MNITLKNNIEFRVGILTQLGHPLLPFWISAINKKNIGRLYVILDSLKFSEKNKKLFLGRTNGYFDNREPLADNNISLTEHHNINEYTVRSHNSEECLALIRSLRLDLLVNCGTPRKLKYGILQSVPRGILNVHPGLLPKYRGSSAVEWSLYNGDAIGNTAHFMDARYDGGNIILQRELNKESLTSYVAVRNAIYLQNIDLMADALELIIEKNLSAEDGLVQNEEEAVEWKAIGSEEMKKVLSSFNVKTRFS